MWWNKLGTDFAIVFQELSVSARKVSVFGVILVRIFPHSDWIRTECGKMRTRKTPNANIFTQCVRLKGLIMLFYQQDAICKLYQKETSTQMFSCEFYEIFQAKLWVAAYNHFN